MADLVPIKTIATAKGPNSGNPKSRPEVQRAAVPGFAAIDYARKLTVAPDGSRITSTEKNVLLHLALAFNSELGVAWPGMTALSKDACTSKRHCRRNLARLEKKKVIQRVPMRRDIKGGGQTSNEYFFPALGVPSQTKEAKARRLDLQKVSRIPMTPVAGKRGQGRPTATVKSVQARLTNVTGEGCHGRPPIESLGERSIDVQSEAQREALTARGRATDVQPNKFSKDISNKEKELFRNLDLARIAWTSAIDEVLIAHGANEVRKFRFRDVNVVSAAEDAAGFVHLTLHSPAADRAEIGIKKHAAVISQTLSGVYGRTVKVRVIRD